MEARIQELEQRIGSLESKPSKSLEFAEKSFKTVLDADIHIDNKASRVLGAIAFLTAATASVFAKGFISYGTANRPSAMEIFGKDVALLAFSIYLTGVLIGAFLYLAALGPSLNIKGKRFPPSLLFFESIRQQSAAEWIAMWGWKGDVKDVSNALESEKSLSLQLEQNYLFETHLISEKIHPKIVFMSVGSFLFKFSLVFLAPLVASLFTTDDVWGWVALLGGLSTFFVAFAFETINRPSPSAVRKAMSYFVVAMLFLICAVSIGAYHL